MGQHKYSQKILPKYVDSDSEVRYIKTDAGGVRYMSNIRIGKRNDKLKGAAINLSLIHISEPTRRTERSRMPSSA